MLILVFLYYIIYQFKKRFPLREKIGFSLDGIRVHNFLASNDSKSTEILNYMKKDARELPYDQIIESMRAFVDNKRQLLPKIISKLNKITQTASSQDNPFKLYSSSLFISYDASIDAEKNSRLKVKLIDFERVAIPSIEKHLSTQENIKTDKNDKNDNLIGPDSNILFGLKNLINIFKSFL